MAVSASRERFVVERGQVFSRSRLWELQRRFFAERGVEAWSRNTVPHYITNNPRLADALARVTLGHLRDRARARGAAPAERTYIVELGAGSGRFAHYFLERLLPRLEASGLDAPVTYVLTDTVPALIDHWRAHPRLRELAARGVLDFARFDVAAPGPIVLAERGTRLEPGGAAPLVVIANYVFDSIPVDCFRVTGGALEAGLVSLSLPDEEPDPTAPHHLKALGLELEVEPVDGAYYGEPDLDAILAGYRERLADTSLLFPIAALRGLAYLRAIGGGALLALVADRGIADEHGLNGRREPELDMHGSFSMLVNLHALAAYARDTGGRAYVAPHRAERLEIVALALGLPETAPETAAAYRDAVEDGGPIDAFVHMKSYERHYAECSLAELIAYLRLSLWDPHIFWRCYPMIVNAAGAAPAAERRELAAALARIWETYFPIGEADDLALALATVHYAMDDLDDARWYAERSIRLHGPRSASRYQLALCYHGLGQHAAAAAELAELLAADPGFAPARELRATLEAEAPRAARRRRLP